MRFLDFLPASAEAPLEQHPAEADLLQDAPLVSVDAEAPLAQQPADLDLSHDAFPSVEAEAPLAQHPADLDLSQLAFLPSLEQVCSVLAFLWGWTSVDCADTVNARKANAPRKRNFFIVLLSFCVCKGDEMARQKAKIQTPEARRVVRERISLFLPSR